MDEKDVFSRGMNPLQYQKMRMMKQTKITKESSSKQESDNKDVSLISSNSTTSSSTTTATDSSTEPKVRKMTRQPHSASAAQNKNSKPVRNFLTLLKGIYNDKDTEFFESKENRSKMEQTIQKAKDDLLFFHGREFKNLIHRSYQRSIEKTLISRIYSNWQRGTKINTEEQPFTSRDFNTIRNTSRIFHICRVPFFFNRLRRILFEPTDLYAYNKFSNKTTFVEKKQIQELNSILEIDAYEQMLSLFQKDYIQYLNYIGIVDYTVDSSTPQQQQQDSTPSKSNKQKEFTHRAWLQLQDQQIVALNKSIVYFQKIMHGGVLLLELTFDSIYIVLNVFVSDLTDPMANIHHYNFNQQGNTSSAFTIRILEKYQSTRKLFLESTAQLKHLLHLNTFVYDFHLRQFFLFVANNTQPLSTPTTPETTIATPITSVSATTTTTPLVQTTSLVQALRDFVQFYPTARTFSRNTLFTTRLTMEWNIKVNVKQKEFFDFVCASAQRYATNTKHTLFSQPLPSSEHYLLLQLNTVLSKEKYDEKAYSYCTIAVLEEEEQEEEKTKDANQKVTMMHWRLYFLYVNLNIHYPLRDSEQQSELFDSKLFEDWTKEMETQLQQMIQTARADFQLDTLWKWGLAFQLEETEFDELVSICDTLNIQKLDSTLNVFNNPYVPWSELMQEICKLAGKNNAGIIYRKDGSKQHLLLKSIRNESILLHLEYHSFSNICTLYLHRKRVSSATAQQKHLGGQFQPLNLSTLHHIITTEEANFVSQFVNQVIYLLWNFAVTMDLKSSFSSTTTNTTSTTTATNN